MPQLGLGTDIGRGTGSFSDPDALAYFATAGIGSGAITPTAYDNAASFNGTTQFLSVASNSTLQSGNGDFTFSLWINSSTWNTGGQNHILAKAYYGGGRDTDYNLYQAGSNLTFLVGDGTSSYSLASASSLPSTNQWWFIVCGYTSSTKKAFISVNGGTSVIAGSGLAGTPRQGVEPFELGCRGSTQYFNGSITGVGFWKRALTAPEITSLYNGGLGLTYAGIQGAGLTTNLISYWALNQTSVTADSAGSNTLTNNGSVTASVQGPIATSTASSRTLINNFVKGVKSLGLWNNMVCWPLRSSQNASSTLTAYSLGGAGIYDGTLVNIPSANWTSTGLLNSATGHVTTGLLTGSTPSNNFVVVNQSSAVGIQTYLGDLSNINSRGIRAQSAMLLVGNGISFSAVSYSAPSTNVFKALNYDVTASLATIYLNGSSIASGALSVLPPAASNTMTFLAANDGATVQYVLGSMAFYMWMNTNLNASRTSQLYALYKQTIGQGLALP